MGVDRMWEMSPLPCHRAGGRDSGGGDERMPRAQAHVQSIAPQLLPGLREPNVEKSVNLNTHKREHLIYG